MLNRRHLRMKVMQALYGLEQARVATYQICMERISHAFDPDWNDERSEALTAERNEKAKKSMQIFRENYLDARWLDTTIEPDVRRTVQQYIKEYHTNMDAERKGFQNGLLRDVNRLYDNYLLLLALPKALTELVEADREMLRVAHIQKEETKGDYKFRENKVALFLGKNDALQLELKKRNLSWGLYEEPLRDFYRSVLRQDKTYQQYNQSKFVTFEEEREIVSHIFRHLVFTQQNLIFFSLKEFDVKRYGLEAMAKDQPKEAMKLQIIKTATETLQANALKMNLPVETITDWAEDMQKHLKDFAQNLAKSQEKERDKPKDKEKDRNFEKEKEKEKDILTQEGKALERAFMDGVRQLHALLRESAHVLVGKLSACLEFAEQNLLDRQRFNIDFIEEALHDFLNVFGVGNHPQDKITLQMENEKGASILQDLFTQLDYNWEENGKVVQSMLMKTIKMFASPAPADFALVELSANWEDDKYFYQELFREAVEYATEADAQISQKAQNWDISRMVGIDRIIMQMAIAEMVHFTSIPVKVSINEYLEIAKVYSTPRSKQFINGMLDQIAQNMQQQGVIRKSGRGLIDNK